MSEEKQVHVPHEDMGRVGKTGALGNLGTNAADHPAREGKEVDDFVDNLVPVEPGTKNLAAALEAVGYGHDEALRMAEAAVEQIETRDRK
jgi:hypothetical protein